MISITLLLKNFMSKLPFLIEYCNYIFILYKNINYIKILKLYFLKNYQLESNYL